MRGHRKGLMTLKTLKTNKIQKRTVKMKRATMILLKMTTKEQNLENYWMAREMEKAGKIEMVKRLGLPDLEVSLMEIQCWTT